MQTDEKNILTCYTDEKGNIEAVLGFKREQLLYDIKNYAYIEGDVMSNDNLHAKHTVQDVGEEGNVDRITRVLDLTVAQCRELLYPFAKNEISKHELNDVLAEQPTYGIVLSLPDDFSQTTLNLLSKLIHEYIVCYAVADWMSIANPPKAATWALKAEDMETQIRIALHSRVKKVRRRLSVF